MRWTPAAVSAWLHSIGLEKYAEQFQALSVDGQIILLDLDRDMLGDELGVPGYDVDRVLTNVRALRNRVNMVQKKRPVMRRTQTMPAHTRPSASLLTRDSNQIQKSLPRLAPNTSAVLGIDDPFSDGADDLAAMLKGKPGKSREEVYRQRIRAILEKHNTKKLQNLESYMTKHRDNIHNFYQKICTKYGEPQEPEFDEAAGREERKRRKNAKKEKKRVANAQRLQRSVTMAPQSRPNFRRARTMPVAAKDDMHLGEDASTDQLSGQLQLSYQRIQQQRQDLEKQRQLMELQGQALQHQAAKQKRAEQEILRRRVEMENMSSAAPANHSQANAAADDSVPAELKNIQQLVSKCGIGAEGRPDNAENWLISGDARNGDQRFEHSMRDLDKRAEYDFETLVETVIRTRSQLKTEEVGIARELAELHRNYLKDVS